MGETLEAGHERGCDCRIENTQPNGQTVQVLAIEEVIGSQALPRKGKLEFLHPKNDDDLNVLLQDIAKMFLPALIVYPVSFIGRYTSPPISVALSDVNAESLILRQVWIYIMTKNEIWEATFSEYYMMSIVMILGSFVAGSTPLGGGVLGYPVSVLVLDFTAGQVSHLILLNPVSLISTAVPDTLRRGIIR